MQLKIKEAHRVIDKLEMRKKEGNDTLCYFYHEGKMTNIFTRIPHKNGDLKGKLPDFIRQQLKLNEEDFINLKKCSLSKDGYIEILKAKGIIY